MALMTNHGKAMLAREEAFVEVSFIDRVNWAIGFSSHFDADGKPIKGGMRWTVEQGVAQMEHDIAVNAKVLERVVTLSLAPNEWDGLHLLAYNIGAGAISRHPVIHWLNAGELLIAADQFLSFQNIGRRQRERILFLTGDYGEVGKMLYYRSDPHADIPDVSVIDVPFDLDAHAGI